MVNKISDNNLDTVDGKRIRNYSGFHIKGTWSVHLFNGNYLSIPEGTCSCEYFFHEIPCM